MLTDLGGTDICYQGPAWTGHLAFVEPDAPGVKDTENGSNINSWIGTD